MHLESVLDIDVAGKDLLIRLDLDVPLSEYVPIQTGDLNLAQGSTEELVKSQGTKDTKSAMGRRGNKAESSMQS